MLIYFLNVVCSVIFLMNICEFNRDEILQDVKAEAAGKELVMAVVQVGNDPASDVYVRNKKKTAEECGIECIHCNLREDASYSDVAKIIQGLNEDSKVTGLMLQLPLPEHLKQFEQNFLDMIDWKKDIDGLSTESVGRLWSNKRCLKPATAQGIMSLLDDDLRDHTVAIINRSRLIGKPLVKMLEERNATPVLCHSKTDQNFMTLLLHKADIIITATGQPKWLSLEDCVTHTIVGDCCNVLQIIDAGIIRDLNGKLCGDVDKDSFAFTSVQVTPVPKGVGILTTSFVIKNVVEAYKLQHC